MFALLTHHDAQQSSIYWYGIIGLTVFLEERRLVKEAEAEGLPGKVFALQWLMDGYILALGAAGVMTTWEIQDEGKGGKVTVTKVLIQSFVVA